MIVLEADNSPVKIYWTLADYSLLRINKDQTYEIEMKDNEELRNNTSDERVAALSPVKPWNTI